jgi:hypothetical protein
VDGLGTAGQRLSADILERLVKFPRHDARELPCDCPAPLELICQLEAHPSNAKTGF